MKKEKASLLLFTEPRAGRARDLLYLAQRKTMRCSPELAVREHGMERVVVWLEVALQHRKRLRRERACPEQPLVCRVVCTAHLDGQRFGVAAATLQVGTRSACDGYTYFGYTYFGYTCCGYAYCG